MDPILEDIKKIEEKRVDYDRESEDYFEVIPGSIPILLSAPHGAACYREGYKGGWKEEDEYTSSLAIKLGELTGAYVIYVKNKTKEDSNYLPQTKYKQAIEKLVKGKGIKFVADIHGLRERIRYNGTECKVIVGIIDTDITSKDCSCRELKPIIGDCFKGFQEPLFNLAGYTAGTQKTVTDYASHVLGIEAAQFEINAKYRVIERKKDSRKAKEGEYPYTAKQENVLQLTSILKTMILRINEKLRQKEKVGLLGCVKKKAKTIKKAEDLYISDYFRKGKEYVERCYDKWFILSAKYHLLQPGIEVEPYDETLKGKKVKEKKEWALKVFEQIKKELPNHEKYELFFHGGNEYRKYLMPICQKGGYKCYVPLEGKKIGEQMHIYDECNPKNPA